jgi:hypothetical protein
MSNIINNKDSTQVSRSLALEKHLVGDADIQKWSRIVLFHAVEHADPIPLWGEPLDASIDVGLAIASQPPKEVKVKVWEMMNPEDADAHCTGEILTIKTLFCPLDTRRPRKPTNEDIKNEPDHSVSFAESTHTQKLTLQPGSHTQTPIHTDTVGKTADLANYSSRDTSGTDVLVAKGPELKRRSTGPLTLLDVSQCPDCVTFSPAIRDDEEMHLRLQFTILLKAREGLIATEDSIDFVAGYTLVASSAIRIAGDCSDPGPDDPRKSIAIIG